MRLPKLTYTRNMSKSTQMQFGGMQQTLGARDGSIWDMQNLTSDNYPLLSTRKPRISFKSLQAPGGLFAHDKLCWVDGEGFYYGGEYKNSVTPGVKQFAALGSKIVIFPDNVYYDTKTDEFGVMAEAHYPDKITFGHGKLYGEDAKANALKTDGTILKNYFSVGDAVTISGCAQLPENNKTLVIRGFSASGMTMYFYENSFKLKDGEEYTETATGLKIQRSVPDLRFGFENENRLWACTGSTICASKTGDVTNWNVFDQLASDSWQVEPSSPGEFTGGINYRGYPVFFKEDKVYKVYGSLPSNFELVAGATLGLEKGSSKSLAVAGETLYYLSRNGIIAYTGGIPQPVSSATLGQKKFRNATAGSDGLKYYVSMEDEDGNWGLYVYDTQKRMWHKEDDIHATHFAYWDGNLYCLTAEGQIWILGDHGMDGTLEEPVEWEVEFNDFTDNSPNKKGIGKLQIRMALEKGATFEAWIQYDSDGSWQKIDSITGEDPKRTYLTPLVPKRCDHCRLKLKGKGNCTIYSITREIYAGSEYKSRAGRN